MLRRSLLAALTFAQLLVPRIVWRIKKWRDYQATEAAKKNLVRFPLAQALVTADEVLARLTVQDAVLGCSCAGSAQGTLRERRSSEEWWIRARTVTRKGLRVELSVVPPQLYAATLVIMTGSIVHTSALCKRAFQGIYGVYFGLVRYWSLALPLDPDQKIETLMRLLRTSNATEIEASEQETSEEATYKRLGMQWIPPALRQGWGEVEDGAG